MKNRTDSSFSSFPRSISSQEINISEKERSDENSSEISKNIKYSLLSIYKTLHNILPLLKLQKDILLDRHILLLSNDFDSEIDIDFNELEFLISQLGQEIKSIYRESFDPLQKDKVPLHYYLEEVRTILHQTIQEIFPFIYTLKRANTEINWIEIFMNNNINLTDDTSLLKIEKILKNAENTNIMLKDILNPV